MMRCLEIRFAAVVLIAVINGVDTKSKLFRLIRGHEPQTEQCVTDHCASSPCKHEGNCTSGSTTFSCQCAHGYKGNTCEDIDHCVSSPCQHNGTCTSGPTTFSCQCADGFIGVTCRDIDHCVSSPCQHNGTCTSGPTTFSCQCADGFIGVTCRDIDHCVSSPCQHNGTCTSGPTTFSCQCADGFIGVTCRDIDHCVSSPCQHNGTCTSGPTTFSCQCADGFIGVTCRDIDHCVSSPCQHNGTCTSGPTTFSCQCADGFIGVTCRDIDHCVSSPCQHNGTCTSGPTTFSCQCADGFIGDTCEVIPKHRTCMEILQHYANTKGKDGVYPIYIDGQQKMVYCDMTTDGGGWTSIQKRVDGSTDFYRNWDNYKTGFGDPFTNYWIGNDAIHILTTENGQELRVDLMSFTGEKVYALYSMFHVGNEASKYKFSASGFSGTAGDGFELTNGIRFSTYDQDNDSHGGVNCASVLQGAWWYSRCSSANLNGKYDATNLYWEPWDTESQIKESMMMIRPKK
ncbi:protein crumbs homolog 2-like isoform X2 [Ostrea edulis]|uniref:protein crumbs homolog 2-like isoform X2 n=1 Tax=Ostrea edulis TaxID=37623 RepID=UPI0024AED2B0|nr:protein crumbs homolog 2-like isoform X2 [Ostrea edulis]